MQDLLDDTSLSMKYPHSIRWLGLKMAVEAVYECYASVISALSHLSSENAKAKRLHKYFSRYQVALLIGLMFEIHTELGVLSCQLQRSTVMFSEAPALVKKTIGHLETMMVEDGESLKRIKDYIVIEEDQAFYNGEKLTHYSEVVTDHFAQTKNTFIRKILSNIRKRIPKTDSAILTNIGRVLDPQCVSDCDKLPEILLEHFSFDKTIKIGHGALQEGDKYESTEVHVQKLIDRGQLLKEWPGVKSMTLKHGLTCPEFSKLTRIDLCIEVTSVECERSFSEQNRLKNKFR